jgi:hypothetical protein
VSAEEKPFEEIAVSASEDASGEIAGVTDATVKDKTGRTWREWFALLDKEGAATLTNEGIRKLVSGKYGIGSLWQQLIASAYERARGLRETGERLGEFGVSATKKVIRAPALVLHAAFAETEKGATWLKARMVVLKKALAKRPNL